MDEALESAAAAAVDGESVSCCGFGRAMQVIVLAGFVEFCFEQEMWRGIFFFFPEREKMVSD